MRLRYRLLPALLLAASAVHATTPEGNDNRGAASADPGPLQRADEGGERDGVFRVLGRHAREAGRAHAIVDLQPMPLADVLADSVRLRVEAAPLERALLDELGAGAQLRWSNGIGQLQLASGRHRRQALGAQHGRVSGAGGR